MVQSNRSRAVSLRGDAFSDILSALPGIEQASVGLIQAFNKQPVTPTYQYVPTTPSVSVTAPTTVGGIPTLYLLLGGAGLLAWLIFRKKK